MCSVDADGNVHIGRGLSGAEKEAAFAAERVILTGGEIVGEGDYPLRPEPHADPWFHCRCGLPVPYCALLIPRVIMTGIIRSTWIGMVSKSGERAEVSR
jgi:hypothetical protein